MTLESLLREHQRATGDEQRLRSVLDDRRTDLARATTRHAETLRRHVQAVAEVQRLVGLIEARKRSAA